MHNQQQPAQPCIIVHKKKCSTSHEKKSTSPTSYRYLSAQKAQKAHHTCKVENIDNIDNVQGAWIQTGNNSREPCLPDGRYHGTPTTCTTCTTCPPESAQRIWPPPTLLRRALAHAPLTPPSSLPLTFHTTSFSLIGISAREAPSSSSHLCFL